MGENASGASDVLLSQPAILRMRAHHPELTLVESLGQKLNKDPTLSNASLWGSGGFMR